MPDDNGVDNPNGTGAASPDKQYLTKDDLLALLKDELPKVVNAAVTSHGKRLSKEFEARLAKLAPTKPAEGVDVEAEGEGEGEHGSATATPSKPKPAAQPAAAKQPDPELVAMQKRFAKLEAELASERTARTRAERQRIEDAGFNAVRSAFAGKVVAGAEQTVVDLLRARNAVTIGDDGSVRLKLRASVDEPDEGLDLDTGIASFLKTREAAFFQPPPNAGPSAGKQRPTTASSGAPPRGGTSAITDPAAAFEQRFGKSLGDALID